jgi:hypothetical protein
VHGRREACRRTRARCLRRDRAIDLDQSILAVDQPYQRLAEHRVGIGVERFDARRQVLGLDEVVVAAHLKNPPDASS